MGTQSGEIVNRLDEGIVYGGHHILAQEAGVRDGAGVTEVHAEALLVDRVLTLGSGNLLLSRVAA
jgi:hypothetical protein